MEGKMKLEIDGMSCQHCVHAVRTALEGLEGVVVTDVQIGSAEVAIDPSRVNRTEVERSVAEEGYQVTAVLEKE
ncbi:MAG: cation transporter [Rhodothermia bacterium]|nr:cation transporter [Rhodothermia bacterium]